MLTFPQFILTYKKKSYIIISAMKNKKNIKGKVWVIKNAQGKLIDKIDTDQIFHNKYLTITNKEKMKDYAFSNLKGWIDFPQKAKMGDILVVGKNFGAGSSRQQAVDCFISLGISAIVGESFGALYKRNAINSGLPIIECPNISNYLSSGDEIEIELLEGIINILSSGKKFNCKPISKIQWDIYAAGGLFNLHPNVDEN